MAWRIRPESVRFPIRPKFRPEKRKIDKKTSKTQRSQAAIRPEFRPALRPALRPQSVHNPSRIRPESRPEIGAKNQKTKKTKKSIRFKQKQNSHLEQTSNSAQNPKTAKHDRPPQIKKMPTGSIFSKILLENI